MIILFCFFKMITKNFNGGQSGRQAESFRAMQKLEIRINSASVTCFDDVKVRRYFGALKPN